MLLTLENNHTIKLEKNERVTWSDNSTLEKGSDEYIIPINNKSVDTITLNDFFINGEEYNAKNGKNCKLYIYQVTNCNCQYFIKDMLSGNGLWNESLNKFVIQDVNSAIKPLFSKLLNKITNIAHRINYAVNGGKKITNNQLRKMLKLAIIKKKKKIKYM